jgi:putative transposase
MASPTLLRGRVSVVNGVYSVTAVTAAPAPLFVDPRNAELVIEALRDCGSAGLNRPYAWVLLPDHLH